MVTRSKCCSKLLNSPWFIIDHHYLLWFIIPPPEQVLISILLFHIFHRKWGIPSHHSYKELYPDSFRNCYMLGIGEQRNEMVEKFSGKCYHNVFLCSSAWHAIQIIAAHTHTWPGFVWWKLSPTVNRLRIALCCHKWHIIPRTQLINVWQELMRTRHINVRGHQELSSITVMIAMIFACPLLILPVPDSKSFTSLSLLHA